MLSGAGATFETDMASEQEVMERIEETGQVTEVGTGDVVAEFVDTIVTGTAEDSET